MSETQQISHRNRVKRVGDTAIKWLNVHTMCWIGQSLNKLRTEILHCKDLLHKVSVLGSAESDR